MSGYAITLNIRDNSYRLKDKQWVFAHCPTQGIVGHHPESRQVLPAGADADKGPAIEVRRDGTAGLTG